MRRHLNLFGAIAAAFFLTALPVGAGTPDGETPAQEAVCDPLMADGITKGLYGLCVAFCEAHDIDAQFDADGMLVLGDQAKPSSIKLYNKYADRQNEDDPDMPCVNPAPGECPCWTQDDLASTPTGGDLFENSSVGITQYTFRPRPDFWNLVVVDEFGEPPFCKITTRIGGVLFNPPRVTIDLEEAVVCIDDLRAKAGAD